MELDTADDRLFSVLIIDDDQSVGEILNRIARKSFPQANFVALPTTDAALNYLNEPVDNSPKLILLDIDFGREVDGLTFLPTLRQHPKTSLTPTIMLSMLADETRVRRAYETGAVSFIEKPMTYEGWQERVDILRSYWYEVVNLPATSRGNDGASHYRALA